MFEKIYQSKNSYKKPAEQEATRFTEQMGGCTIKIKSNFCNENDISHQIKPFEATKASY